MPLFFFLRSVFFYHEVVYDEVLALRCVLSHIILQELMHLVRLVQRDLFEAHLGSDEVLELVGTDFSESFESCYLRIGTQFLYCVEAFLFGVAVACHEISLSRCRSLHSLRLYLRLLVSHTEQRCLQHEHVSLLYQIGEELQEERDDEQSDVHSVHIGIRRHNHLVVSQRVESVLYVEGSLQQVEEVFL